MGHKLMTYIEISPGIYYSRRGLAEQYGKRVQAQQIRISSYSYNTQDDDIAYITNNLRKDMQQLLQIYMCAFFFCRLHIDGSAQDCCNSSALAME